ncbi:MAG: CU044_2847 family protein [Coleofasciculus sp. B1-GNL1-01]|uniref:CU044_2847 family protein n=1 Tax=Coleofasciculus sp. B1-GNL1-01 TaxID=3068484 RepID=UPI0032F9AB3C
MPQLIPIKLDDQTIIYIEATDEVDIPDITTEPEDEEEDEDGEEPTVPKTIEVAKAQRQMVQNFRAIQGTIRAYTIYTLSAFKKMAIANVNKVTLEFGIELGGEAGVPYVTKGTAKSNLKITVECSFPDSTEQDANSK